MKMRTGLFINPGVSRGGSMGNRVRHATSPAEDKRPTGRSVGRPVDRSVDRRTRGRKEARPVIALPTDAYQAVSGLPFVFARPFVAFLDVLLGSVARKTRPAARPAVDGRTSAEVSSVRPPASRTRRFRIRSYLPGSITITRRPAWL